MPTATVPERAEAPPAMAKAGDWMAIYNKDAQKYYFWNEKTQETTWENPVSQEKSQEKRQVQNIDRDLRYLDPALQYETVDAPSSSAPAFSAAFNKASGKLADASRNEDYRSAFQKGRRLQGHFFDTEAFYNKRENEDTRKPSKKQIQMFRKRKVDKKREKLKRWLGD